MSGKQKMIRILIKKFSNPLAVHFNVQVQKRVQCTARDNFCPPEESRRDSRSTRATSDQDTINHRQEG